MSQDSSQSNTDKGADKSVKKEAPTKSTEKPDTGKIPTLKKKATQSKSAKPTSPKAAKTKSPFSSLLKVLLVVFVLVSLATMGGGGYWLYQNRAIFDNNFQQDLAEQRKLLSGVQRGLEHEKEQRLKQGLASENYLSSLANKLASQQQRVQELGGSSRTDWLLAEAEFLLRLGNQRLVIERDATNAKALLENADAILRDLNEVDLLPVRKSLARDITSLAMLEKIDREGLYFRLSAIAGQTALLSIAPQKAAQPVITEVPAVVEAENSWQQLWGNFTLAGSNLMKQAFRIQNHEKPVNPLLNQEQQAVIQSTLMLVLEQAQVAVLRQEQSIYQRSVEKAQKLLIHYYSVGRDVTPLVNQLEVLKGQYIEQPEVNISSSLNNLKTYIDNRHARHSADSPGGQ